MKTISESLFSNFGIAHAWIFSYKLIIAFVNSFVFSGVNVFHIHRYCFSSFIRDNSLRDEELERAPPGSYTPNPNSESNRIQMISVGEY